MLANNTIFTLQLTTPLGAMLAGATAQGICLLEFTGSERADAQLRGLEKRLGLRFTPGESPFFAPLQSELDEYFAGQRRIFNLPLVLAGSPFQIHVWAALQSIPYGETRTYRALAAQFGRPEAARAVGRANGANPIAILIPCHRLVASDGSLTGYGGGLWRKQRLLELENSG